MQTLVERACGMDVHQATVVACLLIVLQNGQVQKQVQMFGTTTRELLALREWLLSQGCTHIAMESTGVYWKPVYAILEGEATFQMVVANAQHVKKVPGRKTDVPRRTITFSRRTALGYCFRVADYSPGERCLSCDILASMSIAYYHSAPRRANCSQAIPPVRAFFPHFPSMMLDRKLQRRTVAARQLSSVPS